MTTNITKKFFSISPNIRILFKSINYNNLQYTQNPFETIGFLNTFKSKFLLYTNSLSNIPISL